MARFLFHEPCPKCGSRDNLARYDDGSASCFGCKHWEPPSDGYEKPERRISDDKETSFVQGIYADIEKRGLTKETCEKWNYQVNAEEGCQIANYRDAGGTLVAQKLRKANKKFSCIGAGKDMPLFGMWLWGGKDPRSIVITEGEIDAMSVSQAFKHKYPVVSLPNGAQSAEKAIEQHYEWLTQFQTVVLMFDQDGPGREATEKSAAILPPGKVSVAVLPRKDASEVLIKDGPAEIVQAYWNAKPWRPDGIVDGSSFTVEMLKTAAVKGFELIRTPLLNERLEGLRKGEVTLFTAGSGIGKSTLLRQLSYDLHEHHGLSIANVFLEEKNVTTAQAYVALDNQVPLRKLRKDPSCIDDEAWQRSVDKVINKGMWFYNHFGSLDSTNLVSKLRYFAKVCKVDFINLDHISIVTSGMTSSSEGERKDIDILMTRLSSLASETDVGINAVVHLKRADGKSFNEGDQVSLNDLRGSAALEQLAWNVVALERNQQADEDEKDRSLIRVLKCRETGDTGPADNLTYNRSTGWLEVASMPAL